MLEHLGLSRKSIEVEGAAVKAEVAEPEPLNAPQRPVPSGIPLSSLNPDADGDGHVEPWEQEVYDRIVAADSDNTGTISQRELFDLIHAMSNEVKDAAKGGIPITALDPDTDGDGKIEPWEADVFRRIQEADADKSGSISVSELFGVIKGAAESDKQKRLFARLLAVSVFIIFLLIGAMLGMGMVAGEAVKESHITGGTARAALTERRRLEAFGPGTFTGLQDEYRRLSAASSGQAGGLSLAEATPPAMMTSTDGQTVVQTDTVETGVSIFDVPLVLLDHGVNAMSKIKRLSFYIDQSADPTPSWKLVSFTVTGFEMDVDNAGVCHLFTASGAIMNLNSMDQNGASAHPLRGQRGRPRPAPPCPRLLTLRGRACCHPGPLGPRRRRLDHGARQYVPHLREPARRHRAPPSERCRGDECPAVLRRHVARRRGNYRGGAHRGGCSALSVATTPKTSARGEAVDSASYTSNLRDGDAGQQQVWGTSGQPLRATLKPSLLGLHALTMRCGNSEPSGVRLRGVGVEFTGHRTGHREQPRDPPTLFSRVWRREMSQL